MSAAVLAPASIHPVTAPYVFPNVHVGAGANSKHDGGIGVAPSLGGDADVALRFDLPATLPSGTAKLRIRALANATSGAAKIRPYWVSVAVEEDPSSAGLNDEGTQTLTWASGDNDQYKELKVTLDADTVAAAEVLVMRLRFETSGWTLAAVATLRVDIIWE